MFVDRYRLEARYLCKGERISWSPFRSLVLHCADDAHGDFFEELFGMLFLQHGAEYLRVARYLQSLGGERESVLRDGGWWKENLEPMGYFFGRLEALPRPMEQGDFRRVVVVRDPRDVLADRLGRQGGDLACFEEVAANDANVVWVEERFQNLIACMEECDAWVHREEDITAAPMEFMEDVLLFLTGHESPVILRGMHGYFFGDDAPGAREWTPPVPRWGGFHEGLGPETRGALWERLGPLAERFGYREDVVGEFRCAAAGRLQRTS